MKSNRPHQILTAVILSMMLWMPAKAQNIFSNAPPQYQPLLNFIETIPTKPLNQATFFINTGAVNLTSFNTATGDNSIVLQNWIDADMLISTNIPIIIGGEVRNVISQIDYGGLNIGYHRNVTTNMNVDLKFKAGWDILQKCPQAGAIVQFQYQITPGTPYVFIGSGWLESIGVGGAHSKSGGGAPLYGGFTFPL